MPDPTPIRAVSGGATGDDASKQSIRMAADRLLVQPAGDPGERKSRAGILIPATADVHRRLIWAEVIQVGPTVRNVEAGDQVLFAPEAGFEVEVRAEEYLILRERDVHAIASERSHGQTGLYL
jgi:chaperonin GroES